MMEKTEVYENQELDKLRQLVSHVAYTLHSLLNLLESNCDMKTNETEGSYDTLPHINSSHSEEQITVSFSEPDSVKMPQEPVLDGRWAIYDVPKMAAHQENSGKLPEFAKVKLSRYVEPGDSWRHVPCKRDTWKLSNSNLASISQLTPHEMSVDENCQNSSNSSSYCSESEYSESENESMMIKSDDKSLYEPTEVQENPLYMKAAENQLDEFQHIKLHDTDDGQKYHYGVPEGFTTGINNKKEIVVCSTIVGSAAANHLSTSPPVVLGPVVSDPLSDINMLTKHPECELYEKKLSEPATMFHEIAQLKNYPECKTYALTNDRNNEFESGADKIKDPENKLSGCYKRCSLHLNHGTDVLHEVITLAKHPECEPCDEFSDKYFIKNQPYHASEPLTQVIKHDQGNKANEVNIPKMAINVQNPSFSIKTLTMYNSVPKPYHPFQETESSKHTSTNFMYPTAERVPRNEACVHNRMLPDNENLLFDVYSHDHSQDYAKEHRKSDSISTDEESEEVCLTSKTPPLLPGQVEIAGNPEEFNLMHVNYGQLHSFLSYNVHNELFDAYPHNNYKLQRKSGSSEDLSLIEEKTDDDDDENAKDSGGGGDGDDNDDAFESPAINMTLQHATHRSPTDNLESHQHHDIGVANYEHANYYPLHDNGISQNFQKYKEAVQKGVLEDHNKEEYWLTAKTAPSFGTFNKPYLSAKTSPQILNPTLGHTLREYNLLQFTPECDNQKSTDESDDECQNSESSENVNSYDFKHDKNLAVDNSDFYPKYTSDLKFSYFPNEQICHTRLNPDEGNLLVDINKIEKISNVLHKKDTNAPEEPQESCTAKGLCNEPDLFCCQYQLACRKALEICHNKFAAEARLLGLIETALKNFPRLACQSASPTHLLESTHALSMTIYFALAIQVFSIAEEMGFAAAVATFKQSFKQCECCLQDICDFETLALTEPYRDSKFTETMSNINNRLREVMPLLDDTLLKQSVARLRLKNYTLAAVSFGASAAAAQFAQSAPLLSFGLGSGYFLWSNRTLGDLDDKLKLLKKLRDKNDRPYVLESLLNELEFLQTTVERYKKTV